MLKILEQILIGYDDLISERLIPTKIYPSKDRKDLGGTSETSVFLIVFHFCLFRTELE